MSKKKPNQEKKDESSLDTPEEVSSPPDGIFGLAKEDKNGFVDMNKVYDQHPEIKHSFVDKIRRKQEMIIDSIREEDTISAGLRDKAMSAKALGEQATELEQGKPMGNIQVFYIKANS